MTEQTAAELTPWALAMHLISAHCDPVAVCRSWEDNADQHKYEHTGPGGIRNHPFSSLHFDDHKIEEVLGEIEAEDDTVAAEMAALDEELEEGLCGT